jgi:2-polyprenyl-6-methoxyphenol hydroxylase-like FAD-dependent oxidoreductase
VAFAPQGNGRARAYVVTRKADGGPPLSGDAHLGDFLAACRTAHVPEEWLADAKPAGPLAQYNCADHWVPHPARAGVALIGDAAAVSDPYMGCGTSLTLTDVHLLRDCLLATNDWQVAAEHYAAQHDEAYGAVHRLIAWQRELHWGTGPAADLRRARHAERAEAEPWREPDLVGIGPASPSDESVRLFLLGA